MTPAAADTERFSPWLSVWFKPRRTIERILATNPRRHVLVLAAVAAAADAMLWLIGVSGLLGIILVWRIVTAVVLILGASGILGLYINAWLLKWLAKPLGGRAATGAIRAALAWGVAPFAVGVPISLVIFMGLSLSGIANESALTIVFQLIAAVLTLWAMICVLLMYGYVQGFGLWRAIANFAAASILFLLIPLAVRTFLFQPFNMPSGSMLPTLLVGDYFFVSKFSYGYTHYSLPLSPPLFSGRIFGSEPQRGDVVVFRLPKDDTIDYVKRIVGLPGDRIQMLNGVLQINGQAIKHERIDDFVGDDGTRVKRFRETLPNGVSYAVLVLTEIGFYDNTPVYTVPAGNYFVLGDNLDNSTDSRVLSQVGYVPFENLIGRAALIYYSTNRDAAPPTIRYDRIGMIVR
ncbi:MAG TPA: signal peptidase I [Xanthobacteraceae bacterium]|nr:signal peptidase I [Xanthobacteraceae bacterium]